MHEKMREKTKKKAVKGGNKKAEKKLVVKSGKKKA